MKLKDQLLALLKSLNLLPADKEKSVSDELDKLDLDKAPAPAIDPSKITDPALKQIVEALNNQVTILGQQNKTLLDTLNAERTEREKSVKLQQDQAKTAAETKVTELVAKALKEGKISKAKEAWLKDLATTKFELAETWVKDAPVEKGFKAEAEGGEKEKKETSVAKPTSMKSYMENRAENTQELASLLAPATKN